jgi:uncharacterized membrane protein (DUF4010 family)
MAILFQLVLFAVTAIRQRFGQPGMILSGAILGFTDMDALVISMAKAAGSDAIAPAAISTTIGAMSNTILKLGVAALFGSGRFRTLTIAGLAALLAISAALLFFLR